MWYFFFCIAYRKGYIGQIFWYRRLFTTIMVRYVSFSHKYIWNTMKFTYVKIKKKKYGANFSNSTSSGLLNPWSKCQRLDFFPCGSSRSSSSSSQSLSSNNDPHLLLGQSLLSINGPIRTGCLLINYTSCWNRFTFLGSTKKLNKFWILFGFTASKEKKKMEF